MKLSLRIDTELKSREDYINLYHKLQQFCAKTADQLGISYYEYVNMSYDFALFTMACGLLGLGEFNVDRKLALRFLSSQFTEAFIEKTKSIL